MNVFIYVIRPAFVWTGPVLIDAGASIGGVPGLQRMCRGARTSLPDTAAVQVVDRATYFSLTSRLRLYDVIRGPPFKTRSQPRNTPPSTNTIIEVCAPVEVMSLSLSFYLWL
ncbi:hypothetical protein ACJJTC_014926 [Scirpophaga incertulas]